ncbi:MAG TPA: ATP synthase F0 subunit C [Chthonomonadaceae bacterium]|jgi:F-type H+-transporting ATPase subunit c|nr:ATP synthase F0 subunit C [Chthonomonadaceae bacterium]
MTYFMALALALGFGVPVAVLSAALGQGKAAAAALEGMARQPEQTGKLQTAMILALAFIESLVIFTLLVFFLLNGKLPETSAILEVLKSAPAAAAGGLR